MTYNMLSLYKKASWNAAFRPGNIFDHISMISEYNSLVHLISNKDLPKIKVIPGNNPVYIWDKEFS